VDGVVLARWSWAVRAAHGSVAPAHAVLGGCGLREPLTWSAARGLQPGQRQWLGETGG